MDWTIADGKTYEDAIENLLLSLGADRSEVEIEKIGKAKKFFGLGKLVCRVRGKIKKEALEEVSGGKVSLEILSKEIAKIGAVLSETAKKSKNFLEKILSEMDIRDVEVSVKEDNNKIKFEISSRSGGLIIGRRGETLEALQIIMEIYAIRHKGSHVRVEVDTEDYRNRQNDKLVKAARSSAREVAKNNRKVRLQPMKASERKVIHAALQDDPLVKTRSEGNGENRRVVIIPVR